MVDEIKSESSAMGHMYIYLHYVLFCRLSYLVIQTMETESVRSARSEPAQRLHNHRHHHHRSHRHRGHSDRNGGAPEQQRLRGPYETDPDTDRDDRSVSTRASRVHRRVLAGDGDDRGSQWGETTTVLTAATSEFNYSLEDVDDSRDVELSLIHI